MESESGVSEAQRRFVVGMLGMDLGQYFPPTPTSRPQRHSLNKLLHGWESTHLHVRGLGVAAKELVMSLCASDNRFDFKTFAANPRRYESWLRDQKGWCTKPDVEHLKSLLRPQALKQIDLWFDPNGFYQKSFEIRDRLADTFYPVTCTIHGLSDNRLLHEMFLPMLLCDTYATDSLICTSEACRRALTNILSDMQATLKHRYALNREYRGRFDVIPLCVDTDFFTPGDKARAKRKLGLSSRCTTLTYIGRLSLLKADLFPLILMLSQIMDDVRKYDLRLLLVGTSDPGFVGRLLAFAREVGIPAKKIHVFEGVTDEKKALLLQASDIFTLPSDTLQESFGLAPVEAMAAGVPQVVSDWSGYRETVKDGVTGFLVPTLWAPCDNELTDTGFLLGWRYDQAVLGQTVAVSLSHWRESILALMRNTALRTKMGAASRERCVSLFSHAAVNYQYKRLWTQLLTESTERSLFKRVKFHHSRIRYYETFKHFSSQRIM